MMGMQSILLVEDSPEMRLLVTAILGPSYNIQCSESVSDAKNRLQSCTFDLVILDIELSDGDGFQLCTWLKGQSKTSDISVVFLSNRLAPTDKVLGFTLGADDYVQKPIEPLEFKARIDARIRSKEKNKMRTESFGVGPFRVEIATSTVYMSLSDDRKNEKVLSLTHKEFKLLVFFLQNSNRILSRQQILDKIWEQSINVTDRTVDSHVHTIRKKIAPFSSQIESVPKEGYRFKDDFIKK